MAASITVSNTSTLVAKSDTEEGQLYYLEAIQKEGGGGDHLSVAWECTEHGFIRDVILSIVCDKYIFTTRLGDDEIRITSIGEFSGWSTQPTPKGKYIM